MIFLILIPIILMAAAFIYMNFVFPKRLENEEKEKDNSKDNK